MQTKKKIIIIAIAILTFLALVLLIAYFSPKTFLKNQEPSSIKSISVFDGNTGEGFVISNPNEIKYIVENISRIKTKRDKISVGYSGFGFRLSFYDEKGKEIDSFIINGENTIRSDPFFYRCNSPLCFEYLKELEANYIDQKGE